MRKIILYIIIAVSCGLGIGALVTAAGAGLPIPNGVSFSILGWLGTSLLLTLAIFILLITWSWAGRSKMLLWMMIVSFTLRLILGIMIGLGIATWGHDNAENNAGYLFLDPYERDTEAWNLAKSDDSIIKTAASGFGNDQYGGLLSVSAFLYRTLSPDGHRPFLILILGAFMAAIGLPFLWKGLISNWGQRVTALTCWIVALYPEGILQGMTQAREPIIIGLFCLTLWGVTQWNIKKWQVWIGTVLPLLGMAWISLPAAIFSLLFFVIWIILQNYAGKLKKWWLLCLWFGIGVGVLLMGVFAWTWFSEAAKWDALEFERSSGFIQLVMDTLGDQWLVPFMTGYGLLQPMFFGALIAKTSAPVFNIIGSIRALGWYLLMPLLIIGLIRIWREKIQPKRRLIVWSMIFGVTWILIASMRSGGDQWDNPRYRIIFLPVLALGAAWALDWARNHKDRWLTCFFLLDLVFNLNFTFLYLWRYHSDFGILIKPQIMVLSVILSTLIICAGIVIWTCVRIKRDKRLDKQNE